MKRDQLAITNPYVVIVNFVTDPNRIGFSTLCNQHDHGRANTEESAYYIANYKRTCVIVNAQSSSTLQHHRVFSDARVFVIELCADCCIGYLPNQR